MRKLQLIMALTFVFILFGCTTLEEQTTTTAEEQTTTTEPTSDDFDLEIHVIDVGQADSIFFKLPNGEHMLIDAGNNPDGDLVVSYLTTESVAALDYVIGTHPHEDHIGGLDDVINAFEIDNLYLPNATSTTDTYNDVIDAITSNNLSITEAKVGVTLFDTEVDSKTLKAVMLSPISESYSNTNDYSPVIKLTYGVTSYIFTGDAENDVEDEIMESDVDLAADVLKVGHHGSSTSTSQAFLDKVSPEFALISVGTGNTYGHPAQETIDRLTTSNIDIYRTDLNGTIIVKSNGTDIQIESSKETEPTNPTPNPIEPIGVGVYINEIVPAPSTGNEEWVELFNSTNEAVDISGFIIDDIESGGSAPLSIPDGTIIEANGYYVHYISGTYLNNAGDDVRLLDSNSNLLDFTTYSSSVFDHSWYRETDGGNWASSASANPTPGTAN